ncbi:ABC transporter ATP-binding protein [Castellaniella sp.]|uniref:ABC transporter ATP-binding protein n=1 Tax=Castellaniella sp. TaxID=1955812 RepID=UPI002B0006CD|nr:ABC transporter ATP-binding protein [Castellaniella sp.]
MTNETTILNVTDVAVHYGGVKAVDGVSFDLNQGEIHGLIGPNGAGKSTVIDAISGRRHLTRGTIRLAGQDITRLGVIERRKCGLARSFQRTSIFANMPVNAQIGLAALKVGAEAPEQDARRVMDQLDLTSVADATAGSLGYGQQRRLDLALALVGRPVVLLLDEPMAGLSAQESADLAAHLQKLTSDCNVSILLVEHDTDTLFSISDSITVFELGHVIASGRPEEVRTQPRVREAYLGSAA